MQAASRRSSGSLSRLAVVAGATGRLGEALLSEVVGSGHYGQVLVLTERPLTSSVRGLSGRSLASLSDLADDFATAAVERPKALDVFACWSDPDDPFGRTANQRDVVYAQLVGPEAVKAVSITAAALRADRLLVLAPLVAWQQVSAASRMLPQAMEMDLARLPIRSVIIMRPSVEKQPSRSQGTPMQRFARLYLSQLRFMLPASTQALRSSDIARAALAVMAESTTGGLHVVPLDAIRAHAANPSIRDQPHE